MPIEIVNNYYADEIVFEQILPFRFVADYTADSGEQGSFAESSSPRCPCRAAQELIVKAA